MGKVVCIVQARTTSERFPMKILAGLHGRPMLAHVLERAAAIQGVDQVVLAVPENDVRLVSHLWPHVYGGSEKDVLSRYAGAAEKYEADVIVRVTGDCCLLASDICESSLQIYISARKTGLKYFAVCQPYRTIADGWDHEIFDMNYLIEANANAGKSEREHVTTWMRADSNPLCIDDMEDTTALKCSVDTREDLQRVEKIMNCLEDKTDFSHAATWRAWEKAGRP